MCVLVQWNLKVFGCFIAPDNDQFDAAKGSKNEPSFLRHVGVMTHSLPESFIIFNYNELVF